MPRVRIRGALERSAIEDLWKHTLCRIPTRYGRLTYLASLRDPNSGTYRHYGLSAVFGREEGGKALRESHRKTFTEWLNLSLQEQTRDLGDYLSELEEPRGMVVDNWLKSGGYRAQIPDSAHKMQRELFCRDLEAVLEIFRDVPSGGASARGSSRRV